MYALRNKLRLRSGLRYAASALCCLLCCPLCCLNAATAEDSFVVEDRVFRSNHDSTEQRYVVMTPRGWDGRSPISILMALHGHGSDRWQFVRQPRDECEAVRAAAAEHSMLLVAPDYRATTSWMGPAADADVLQLLQQLRQRFAVDRVIIAGGSMGGTAALTFAALHPEAVDGVVALNGTANLLEYDRFQDAITASFGGSKQQIPEEYRKRSAEFHAQEFTMPLAVTTGGRDEVVPCDSTLRLVQAVRGHNNSVLSIHRADGGHSTNEDDTRKALEFVLAATQTQTQSETAKPLIQSITKETLWTNRDGKSRTWFHPRVCMIPDDNGKPVALMTLQEIGGSDYFGPVHWSVSEDLGRNWSDPEPIPTLGRDPVPGRTDDLKAGVCDVTPQYHPATGTVIALGHVVFYKGQYFARKEQLARYPVYVTRSQNGEWSKRKILQWDDPRGAHIYTNNCGQRVVLRDGSVQMSFTFGPEAEKRMVAGVRATFDGRELKVAQVGPPLQNPIGRGLLEPSITTFKGKFWLTMRAEDSRGYVSVSDDGLNWASKKPWTWDDGSPLEMSTTQQHWLTHSDGLFLVYTRKDTLNENVIRWRSPLWVAQVDVQRRCLIRSSEQIVLPLVGDGVEDADRVALMGNFNVTNVSDRESWVTVGEWMPRCGYRGNVLLARIRWARPNRDPIW